MVAGCHWCPCGSRSLFSVIQSNTNKSRLCHSFGERSDATRLGVYRPNASLKYSNPSTVPWLCPSPPPSASVKVRDFWSRLLPDHSPFDPSAHYQVSLRHLTQLTQVRRGIFQRELTRPHDTSSHRRPRHKLGQEGRGSSGRGSTAPSRLARRA